MSHPFLTRNFGLLSFGEEAEEDETETNDFVQKNATKSKSVHDVINDPKLSKEAVQIEKSRKDDDPIEENAVGAVDETPVKEKTERIRDKLKRVSKWDQPEKKKVEPEIVEQKSDSDSDDYGNELEKERKLKRQKKA